MPDLTTKIGIVCFALAVAVGILWLQIEARTVSRDGRWHMHETIFGFGSAVMRRWGPNGWETRPVTQEEWQKNLTDRI